jgi:hypothetical protein
MALHQSQLEVLIDGFEWICVSATLDETALTLSPPSDGFLKVEDGIRPTVVGGWNMEKRVVRVIKQEGHGLGLSIQGGADNGKPIVISKIFPAMAADQTGQLLVGDVILSVNGQSLVNSRHEDAVKLLKRAGKIVNLEVQHRGEALLRKEENLLQRLTWDDEDKLDSRDRVRSFPLKLAFVTRTCLEREDIENRTLEIRSHSARHTLTLRCRNSLEADAWFEAAHSCADALGIQAQAQVNLILGQSPQIRRMGWLAERVQQQGESGTQRWKPIFVGLTTNDLLFYDFVPAIKQEWASPKWSCPLIATRLISTTARSFPVISGLSDTISFSMRTGTQDGVRTHIFRVETHRELAAWVW